MLTVCTFAVSAHGQGTLVFKNTESTLVHVAMGMPLPTSPPVPIGEGFVQLLWAPAGSEWNQIRTWDPLQGSLANWLVQHPAWTAVPESITPISSSPGRFDGGTLTLPTPTPGAGIEVAIIGWSGNFASFDDAVAVPMVPTYSPRESFFVDTGNPLIAEAPASITASGQFAGMTLQLIIPEPSSTSLTAMGVGLVMYRRRKRLFAKN